MGVLGFLLVLYRMRRAIIIEGVASDVFWVLGTIVAGCPFVTTLLKALLLSPLDDLTRVWPSARLAVVVDDILVLSLGRVVSSAVGVVKGAIRTLVGSLEGQAGLVVS